MSLRLSGGRRLRSPTGTATRPTPARVRLALMNLLAREIPGCRWLDLCCGSALVGCEALQRGAAAVVAVERDRRTAQLARGNLEAVAAARPGAATVQVLCRDVLRFLASRRSEAGAADETGLPAPFDLIFADPPYAEGLHGPLARGVLRGGWLREGGTLVLECSSTLVPPLEEGWRLRDRRRYGSTTLLLWQAVSAAQGTTAPVLVPGGHEQAGEGDGDQSEHDAAEQGFDHRWIRSGRLGRLGRSDVDGWSGVDG